MVKKINISVVIPTYKRLKQTVSSLRALEKSIGLETRFTLEVILVDDSPNNVLFRYISKMKWVFKLIPIRIAPTPVGKKREIGAKRAGSELIIFMDSDIEVYKDTVWKIVSSFKDNPRAGMVSPLVFFPKKIKGEKIDRPQKIDRRLKIGRHVYLETNFGRCLAIYRGVFFKVGGYDYRLFTKRGEGVDFSARVWRSGFPIVFSRSAKVIHHVEAPDSLTRSKEGNVLIYESLALLAAKYSLTSVSAPYFFEVLDILMKKTSPSEVFLGGVRAIYKTNLFIGLIKQSQRNIPKQYPFTPQDVFTYKKEVRQCIGSAQKRLKSFYDKTFR